LIRIHRTYPQSHAKEPKANPPTREEYHTMLNGFRKREQRMLDREEQMLEREQQLLDLLNWLRQPRPRHR